MASLWRVGTLVVVLVMGLDTGACIYDKHFPEERSVNVSIESLIELRGVEECDLGNGEALKVYLYDLPYKFHFGLFSEEDVQSLPEKPDKAVRMPYKRREDGSIAGRAFEHGAEAYVTFDLLAPPKVLPVLQVLLLLALLLLSRSKILEPTKSYWYQQNPEFLSCRAGDAHDDHGQRSCSCHRPREGGRLLRSLPGVGLLLPIQRGHERQPHTEGQTAAGGARAGRPRLAGPLICMGDERTMRMRPRTGAGESLLGISFVERC